MDPILYHYETHAERLCDMYEGTTFHQAQAMASELLPASPTRIIDIGCGSGRDAAAMAALGHDVTAVDVSDAMLTAARRWHGTAHVRWLRARLPGELPAGPYGFMLCSAVLMHLQPVQIGPAFDEMSRNLTADGILVLGIRQPRADDPPGVYAAHDVETIVGAASAAGLEIVAMEEPADALMRSGIEWTAMAFRPSQTRGRDA